MRRCIPTALGAGLALLLGLGGFVPRADGRGRDRGRERVAVEQSAPLLAEGRRALSGRDPVTAYRLASQAYRLASTPEALFLLGQVALAESRLLDAQDLMRRYLADPDLETTADSTEQKEAQRILDQPRPAAAQLSVLGDRGAVVVIDDRVVGVLPLVRPLLVAPGEHKVLLERHSVRLEDQVRIAVGRLGELRCNFATRALVLSVLPGVLLFDQSAGLAATEVSRLAGVLETTLLAQRLSPLAQSEAGACGEPAPGTCSSPLACQLLTAQRCEADYILTTRVQRLEPPPGRLRVEAELIDVSVGESAAEERLDCPGCSTEKALADLEAKLPSLLGRAVARPRGRIEVSSQPPGAQVVLDGRPVGTTPFEGALWAGSHALVVRRDGFLDFSRPVEVGEGQTAQVAASLPPRPVAAPSPPPPPPMRPPTRPLWRLLTGGIALGAGAVLGGFGVSALTVNGNCLDQPFQRSATCPDLYATAATGGALVGVGSALVIGGAVLIALPPPPRRPTPATENQAN